MNHNIIITSAGQRVALVRDFKETLVRFYAEAKVFTTDMNPELAPAAYVSDGCFEVLRVTDENYISQLLDICKKNEIGMIVPTIDTELLVLAENKKLFNDNDIIVCVSDLDFIKVCRDKRNTGDFLEKHNIRVPKAVDKYNPTFPLFAKPYDGSLSTNLHYIKNAEELTQDILDDPKLLFMEYIDKETYKEYTIDMYWPTDDQIKQLKDLIDTLDTPAYGDNTILTTIVTDCIGSILGDDSIDDDVAQVVKDINIYLSE